MEAERGRQEGGRRNVEASLIVGADESTNRRTSRGFYNEKELKEKRARDEKLLEDYARKEGIWLNYQEETKDRLLSKGREADVYKGNTQGTVKKLIYPYADATTLLEFLDNKISLNNYLFSKTPYQVLGFTRSNKGTFFVVVEQPYINHTGDRISNPQIFEKYKSFLQASGWNYDEDSPFIIWNDKYIVHDLHEDNILIDKDGNFYFIDTSPKLNTAKYGGEQEYGDGSIIDTSPNVDIVEDEHVNEWVELDISSEKARNRPIVSFHSESKKKGEDTEKNATFVENIFNEKGEINYEELKRTTDAIEEITSNLNRLSLAEEQGRRQGGRRNVEASVLLTADERANSEKIRNAGTRAVGERAKRQEELLKDYAKKEGIWISPEEIEQWEYKDTGMEARVYKAPNSPDHILKVVYNYKNFSETPLEYLDNRISLHNYLFGNSNTDYELIGFTETYGATKETGGQYFAPVIRQRYVQGSELKESELQMLDAEMEKRGFEKTNGMYVNKDYIIEDLHADNVIKDEQGNFHFIDTVPSLNTPEDELGGERTYGNGSIIDNSLSEEIKFQIVEDINES
ncbi:MAG: hypothetical protein LBE13_18975, partial [Bacteroidales bacterium]|nr:hypothetical protein [Bacteroidales bacterium]